MTDEVMAAIGAAVEQGRAGDRAGARDALTALWDRAGDDPLKRCSIAHYVADLQDSVADELAWDQRALAAANDLADPSQLRSFLPSLHLNLADAHRRSGHTAEARHHLGLAAEHLDLLPDDDYGRMIRGGMIKAREALDAGSSRRL
jgi:hypothetical protein